VGLERGPLSLVNTIEELLERNSSGSGLETREYGGGDRLRGPRSNPLSAKVGTNFAYNRSRTKAMEFVFVLLAYC
jgi:hypothetical protein